MGRFMLICRRRSEKKLHFPFDAKKNQRLFGRAPFEAIAWMLVGQNHASTCLAAFVPCLTILVVLSSKSVRVLGINLGIPLKEMCNVWFSSGSSHREIASLVCNLLSLQDPWLEMEQQRLVKSHIEKYSDVQDTQVIMPTNLCSFQTWLTITHIALL